MQVTGITPQLRTTNLDESIEFYVAKLGFQLESRYEDFYAGIGIANGQQIHLKLVDNEDPSIEFVGVGGHHSMSTATRGTFCALQSRAW